MKWILLACLFTSYLYANTVGYSTYPLMPGKNLLSSEFTGVVSEGGGVGIQARYTRKLNKENIFDAGFGVAGGERNAKLFMGLDRELYPDYMKQPRISLKGVFEYAQEFDSQKTIFTVAPTISKGFNMWGHEAFPFIAIPVGFDLNNDTKTYESIARLSMGISGKLPIKGYQHLTSNFEVSFNLKDSYSGVALGVSYAID